MPFDIRELIEPDLMTFQEWLDYRVHDLATFIFYRKVDTEVRDQDQWDTMFFYPYGDVPVPAYNPAYTMPIKQWGRKRYDTFGCYSDCLSPEEKDEPLTWPEWEADYRFWLLDLVTPKPVI